MSVTVVMSGVELSIDGSEAKARVQSYVAFVNGVPQQVNVNPVVRMSSGHTVEVIRRELQEAWKAEYRAEENANENSFNIRWLDDDSAYVT
jgi:hypothetical protein